MLALGLIFAVLALGFFCWLLFNLAVYFLPCFIGVNAGLWSYHHGSGLVTAMLVGLICAAASLVLGGCVRLARKPNRPLSIGLLFAVPAAFAGLLCGLGSCARPGRKPSLVRRCWHDRRAGGRRDGVGTPRHWAGSRRAAAAPGQRQFRGTWAVSSGVGRGHAPPFLRQHFFFFDAVLLDLERSAIARHCVS